jgi:hypothetical protein
VRRPGRVDHLLRHLLDVPRPIASTVMRVIALGATAFAVTP